MATSSYFADATVIADMLEETSGGYVSGYAIEDPSNTATSLDINQDEYTELEYAVVSTINASSDAYCLRVVNSGTELDSYASVAEFSLAYDPVLSSVSFNNGADISLLPGKIGRASCRESVFRAV